MTRAVLFDFYGTLARAVAWGPTFEEVLAGHGVSLNRVAHNRWQDEVADGVDHADHSVDRDRYVAWERARLRKLAAACGARDDDAVAEALYRAVKTYTLLAYDEVPEVLVDLRSRGLRLVICSNWDWDLEHALASSGLEPGLFDAVVTSAQAGARKPHPRIYAHTLERCGGIAAEDVLFVGDTWGPDVAGPQQAGMRAVQVWRDDALGDPPPDGTAWAPDLRSLADFL